MNSVVSYYLHIDHTSIITQALSYSGDVLSIQLVNMCEGIKPKLCCWFTRDETKGECIYYTLLVAAMY